MSEPRTILGIGASAGIAIAQAYPLQKPALHFELHTISDTASEIQRYQMAAQHAVTAIEQLIETTASRFRSEETAIFSAHILLIQDPEFNAQIEAQIQNLHCNAEHALVLVRDLFVQMFEALDDAYFRERASDIRDISDRILAQLLGVELHSLNNITHPVIVVASDLTPSDTAQLNPNLVLGFVTEQGGRTSHSAIMARQLGIPAVVGVENALQLCANQELLLLDGYNGKVIIRPSPAQQERYQQRQAAYREAAELWQQHKDHPSCSADGVNIQLAANIGQIQDLASLPEVRPDGIGLYRSEFLFMQNPQLPTEDQQYQAYTQAVLACPEQLVIIRTLDIGADKQLSYWPLPHEDNPFLGSRGSRLMLKYPEVMCTQLRALLRASVHGQLGIMFPMISTLSEWRTLRAWLEHERKALQTDGIAVASNLQVGIMVEVPSAALLAEQFAQEVDFFSIGTNDLSAYTLAADRLNPLVASLYQPLHPAVLQLIHLVCQAGRKAGKWVGVCGELAGEELALPVLLGLGVQELSMNPNSIMRSRYQLHSLDAVAAQAWVPSLLTLGSEAEVIAAIQARYPTLQT